MDSYTEKTIAKHREVYKLNVVCMKLARLATKEHGWIEKNPDASSRCIEMQQLRHKTRDSMNKLVAIAETRCILIDRS